MATLKPILRPQSLRSALSISQHTHLCASTLRPTIQTSIRAASSTTTPKLPQIPEPTPFVPDVPTFLTVIGRGLSTHASKIPDWETLFTLTSEQMRELGIEPPRARKYLLRWRQRFREGKYGIGGDLTHVTDGVADLRVLETDPEALGKDIKEAPRKVVVNVPNGRTLKECSVDEISRVQGFHVEGAKAIVGPYALPVKGGDGAQVTVTEGMWEDIRGRKIDGGERRQTEIRYLKRVAERREARERGEL
ncbi:IGR protein motif-domain-containing protein [Xylariaceae sp. FL1272]|nr:IGR protein motif-domain-containing protein [Xylariaceae sp. FL1272]